jgi:hypothetical protein
MAAVSNKSWQEEYNVGFSPTIEKASKDFAGIKAGQIMLIPTPALVDAYIKQVPQGSIIDIAQLRKDLAAEYHAEVTCPLTTGIFLRIVSELALEQLSQGRSINDVTPFWRVIDPRTATAKKLSCGPGFITQKRKNEKRRKKND